MRYLAKTKEPSFDLIDWEINRQWTLCLDRDGVINRRILGGYVTSPALFHFLPGVLDALPIFHRLFDKIFIITNQSGVGKGLMRMEDLTSIHDMMLRSINTSGGKITKIYACTLSPDEEPNCRKPSLTMGQWLLDEFPTVRPDQSIMVGDTLSDMMFGRHLGMKTILISGIPEEQQNIPGELIDLHCDSLLQLAWLLLK